MNTHKLGRRITWIFTWTWTCAAEDELPVLRRTGGRADRRNGPLVGQQVTQTTGGTHAENICKARHGRVFGNY